MLAAIEQEGNGLQLEQEQSRETMKWLNAGMEERPRVAVASGHGRHGTFGASGAVVAGREVGQAGRQCQTVLVNRT